MKSIGAYKETPRGRTRRQRYFKGGKMRDWKEVESINLFPNEKVVVEGSRIVIYKRDERPRKTPRDVTSECRVELCRSSMSSGHYVGIFHGDRKLFALGVDEKSKIIPLHSSGYRIELAPGANVSFKITKE